MSCATLQAGSHVICYTSMRRRQFHLPVRPRPLRDLPAPVAGGKRRTVGILPRWVKNSVLRQIYEHKAELFREIPSAGSADPAVTAGRGIAGPQHAGRILPHDLCPTELAVVMIPFGARGVVGCPVEVCAPQVPLLALSQPTCRIYHESTERVRSCSGIMSRVEPLACPAPSRLNCSTTLARCVRLNCEPDSFVVPLGRPP